MEGGLGTDQEGIIHPFYLTSDNEGGYGTKSDYEARVGKNMNTDWEVGNGVLLFQMEEIYGGLSRDRDGLPVPAVMGRLCLWRSPRAPPTFATYEDFKSSLAVTCQETGEPGVLRFSPDYEMPGVMYYQVRNISQSYDTAEHLSLFSGSAHFPPSYYEADLSSDGHGWRFSNDLHISHLTVIPEFFRETGRREDPPAGPVPRDSQVLCRREEEAAELPLLTIWSQVPVDRRTGQPVR